jgi:hypothetical protein
VQRDMEVVREVLRKIRDADGKLSSRALTEDKTPEEAKIIFYHLGLLGDADLLDGVRVNFLGGEEWVNLALTWNGQEYSEKILATSELQPAANPPNNSGTDAKLGDAVILKPAFMGIGVDLPKAWKWIQRRWQKTSQQK